MRIREAQKHIDPTDPDRQWHFKPQVPKTLVLVPQAIRDGVIEASLDHENGWMQSKDTSDIYATRQDHTHTASPSRSCNTITLVLKESFNTFSEGVRNWCWTEAKKVVVFFGLETQIKFIHLWPYMVSVREWTKIFCSIYTTYRVNTGMCKSHISRANLLQPRNANLLNIVILGYCILLRFTELP